ncbi:MAG: hypothetical protein AAFY11_15335 [Cyanobacteria bacterium J06641_5]
MTTLNRARNFRVGDAPTGLVSADFKGDSNRALAVASLGDDLASVLLGDGNGGFVPQQTFAVGADPYSFPKR